MGGLMRRTIVRGRRRRRRRRLAITMLRIEWGRARLIRVSWGRLMMSHLRRIRGLQLMILRRDLVRLRLIGVEKWRLRLWRLRRLRVRRLSRRTRSIGMMVHRPLGRRSVELLTRLYNDRTVGLLCAWPCRRHLGNGRSWSSLRVHIRP
jgi:hypothetical protein